jgi:putative transposase
MKFDPRKHRRSIRLKGYDYTTPGAYFITICTYQRECLFGEIINEVVILNGLGEIVKHAWHDLPNHYSHVFPDQFCIMPNHVHGIIILTDSPVEMDESHGRGGSQTRPYDKIGPLNETRPDKEPLSNPGNRYGLPEVVRAFKSFSSRRINEILDSPGVPTWQRNYYEHIVRNQRELRAIQEYILANPINWALDQDNPENLIR